jgi:tRNA dimethylallyltransferase
MADPVLVLTGPTASGKTALGIEVAERIGGEIISADSRQVYRGMDVGTAKATAEERARVPHHGLDLVDPDVRYSAGRFARDARRWVELIRRQGHVPMLVGGTGFFLRAVTKPLFQEPPLEPERRARLNAVLDSLPGPRLRDWLETLDPVAAQRLRAGGGRQRVVRALEIALLTGRPLHWWHRTHPSKERPLDAVTFVLDLPRDLLDDRIDRRVGAMMEAGLVGEVRDLLRRGYSPDDPGLTATGYPETVEAITGRIDMEEATERIRRATRRYARRQVTWFRHQLPPDALWLDATLPLNEQADEVVRRWQSAV